MHGLRCGWGMLLATATAIGCSVGPSNRADESVGSGTSALIVDDAHGGNRGFFFLPPMVPTEPVLTGTFDADASPVVTITELDAATLTPTSRGLIATFTKTSGPDGEVVLERRKRNRFVVRWKTKLFSLDDTRRYRVAVSVDGRQLGYADVEPVAKVKGKAGVDTSQFVPVKNGDLLRIPFYVAKRTACSALSFDVAGTYTTAGSIPIDVALGDTNGDGKLDVAAGDYFGGAASFLGNGDGTFVSAGQYAGGGGGVNSLVLADMDGDGTLDGLLGLYTANSVSILHGNGDGSFAAPLVMATNADTQLASAIDLNGDGRLDVVASNIEGTITVMLQNSDGTFAAPVAYPVAAGNFQRPQRVRGADLNGDGNIDLAIANVQTLAVLLGNGDGTFGAATMYPTAGDTEDLALADLDGDGVLDAALSGGPTNSVSILFGNGDGTFGLNTDYAVGQSPYGLAVGDLDGDGTLDLVTANETSSDVTVLLNQGSGTFVAVAPLTSSQLGSKTAGIALGDLDGDGKLDLVTTEANSDQIRVLRNTCQ